MLESLFRTGAGPEVCLSMNFAKLLRTRSLQNSSGGPTDYSRLYNFISNSNGISIDRENCLDFVRI